MKVRLIGMEKSIVDLHDHEALAVGSLPSRQACIVQDGSTIQDCLWRAGGNLFHKHPDNAPIPCSVVHYLVPLRARVTAVEERTVDEHKRKGGDIRLRKYTHRTNQPSNIYHENCES